MSKKDSRRNRPLQVTLVQTSGQADQRLRRAFELIMLAAERFDEQAAIAPAREGIAGGVRHSGDQ